MWCSLLSAHSTAVTTGAVIVPFALDMILLQLEDCALQLYKYNNGQGDYGTYLDLESSLEEQYDELEGFSDWYAPHHHLTASYTTDIRNKFTSLEMCMSVKLSLTCLLLTCISVKRMPSF